MSEQTQIPRVLWAQQRETVLLTVTVPDIEKVNVKFEENSVSFHGQSTSKDKTVYAVKIDLYEKIDPEACKYDNVGQKYWRLLLQKKDSTAAFWPRLTKEKGRLHWLQTDFDHWKDENESDDEKPGMGGNFQDMFPGGKSNSEACFNITHQLLFKAWVEWVAWMVCQVWVAIMMMKRKVQTTRKDHPCLQKMVQITKIQRHLLMNKMIMIIPNQMYQCRTLTNNLHELLFSFVSVLFSSNVTRPSEKSLLFILCSGFAIPSAQSHN
jgi:hypothetical protein